MTVETAEEWCRLRESDDPDERDEAVHADLSLEVWLEIIRDPSWRWAAAHAKKVPLGILRTLARDPDPRVRWMTAMKRTLDAESLTELAHDADETIRHAVARNGSTPPSALRQLARDRDAVVREAAAERLK